jgi:hypothetical protein
LVAGGNPATTEVPTLKSATARKAATYMTTSAEAAAHMATATEAAAAVATTTASAMTTATATTATATSQSAGRERGCSQCDGSDEDDCSVQLDLLHGSFLSIAELTRRGYRPPDPRSHMFQV